MPWLVEADVGLVFVAFLLALLCFGVGYLIKAIAAAIPDIPLPFGLSIPLSGIFSAITLPVANWLLGVGAGLFGTVENLLRGIGYMIVQLLFGTVQTGVQHASQIQYLHNVGIPAEGRAAANTAIAQSASALQLVRTEIHAAQVKWEGAHSYADAVTYVNLEVSAPSVEHAFLAGLGRTLIASENHAQDLHDQLRDYIGKQITGQADVAVPYTGQTLTGVSGAIAIPGPVDLSNVDVQDIIKTGSQIAIGTAVAVIATKIVECLVSNCSGNNNFQNLLNDALGLLAAAEFADFVKNFVENPEGTINSYTAPFVAAYQGGAKDVNAVWGDIEQALGL